ncbi:hypothetical protein [Burkholderia sp. BE12]|uniref:hypothetical protein n=1 Tax=Burkholderia sp. BE12 TaxID=2082394 RepID=UPI00131A3B17|nr:hypothetical protein [Burkholderia sp. BE12]
MSDDTLDQKDPEAYDNGMLCSWCGKQAADMTPAELIAFIGMLDTSLTAVSGRQQKMQDLIDAQREVISRQEDLIAFLGGGDGTRH